GGGAPASPHALDVLELALALECLQVLVDRRPAQLQVGGQIGERRRNPANLPELLDGREDSTLLVGHRSGHRAPAPLFREPDRMPDNCQGVNADRGSSWNRWQSGLRAPSAPRVRRIDGP